MMADAEYRIYLNNQPVTRDLLDNVEEITVEQEVDMAWEARVKIPVCMDEKGKWTGEDEDFMKSKRLRIEIRTSDGPYSPLIDGPIIGSIHHMRSDPGVSHVTLISRDDSAVLDKEADIAALTQNTSDYAIAQNIFDNHKAEIPSTDIPTPSPPGKAAPIVMQRGTEIQLLRNLARRQGVHAYVLPGDKPGQSVGCFKRFATKPEGLPPLTLEGENRNLSAFNDRNDALRPTTVKASYLSITDKTIHSSTANFSSADLMGSDSPLRKPGDAGVSLLSPYQISSSDLDVLVQAEAADSSYAFGADGNVLDGCYKGILQPYHVVTVLGANSRLSGDHLIAKVSHKLGVSSYSQAFTFRRNARSAGSSPSSTSPLGGIT